VARGEEHIVVLRDDAGGIYLFDHHSLEQTRVPKKQVAEVEQALKGSAIDVSVAVDKKKVAEGGLRLESVKSGSSYNVVGSYTLHHTGGLSISEILRAL
jgi:hypothetical protein